MKLTPDLEGDYIYIIKVENVDIEISASKIYGEEDSLQINFSGVDGDFDKLIGFLNPVQAMREILNSIAYELIPFLRKEGVNRFTIDAFGKRLKIYSKFLKRFGYEIVIINNTQYIEKI